MALIDAGRREGSHPLPAISFILNGAVAARLNFRLRARCAAVATRTWRGGSAQFGSRIRSCSIAVPLRQLRPPNGFLPVQSPRTERWPVFLPPFACLLPLLRQSESLTLPLGRRCEELSGCTLLEQRDRNGADHIQNVTTLASPPPVPLARTLCGHPVPREGRTCGFHFA